MSFREVKTRSRRRLRPRGTWTVVILLAALAAHPAAAQVEKILDTPAGWTYRYGVTAATITADVNAGLRPFSLQRTSSTTCDVVTVQNTGDYAVSGFGTGNLHYNRTIAQLGNDLANRRLIKVE